MAPKRDDWLAAFEGQAAYCRKRDAALTASVIDAAAADIKAGGALAGLVADFDEDPARGALALRIAGAAHYLAIKGRAGPLQQAYENAAPLGEPEMGVALAALAPAHLEVFRDFIARPPQTNEINRLAALLPAFSQVAKAHRLPLDLYELGASGGLLLSPDRCAIDYGSFNWGDGPLTLTSHWRGAAPDLVPALSIRNRSGCDRRPIDFSDPEQLDIARSYIWPEHKARRRMFDAAVAEAQKNAAQVDRADALVWLAARAIPQPGAVSVVFTSVFAVYLDDTETARMNAQMVAFGSQATEEAPVAFIQFEPEDIMDFVTFNIDVTMWPGGARRRIATANAHGAWVEPTTD